MSNDYKISRESVNEIEKYLNDKIKKLRTLHRRAFDSTQFTIMELCQALGLSYYAGKDIDYLDGLRDLGISKSKDEPTLMEKVDAILSCLGLEVGVKNVPAHREVCWNKKDITGKAEEKKE